MTLFAACRPVWLSHALHALCQSICVHRVAPDGAPNALHLSTSNTCMLHLASRPTACLVAPRVPTVHAKGQSFPMCGAAITLTKRSQSLGTRRRPVPLAGAEGPGPGTTKTGDPHAGGHSTTARNACAHKLATAYPAGRGACRAPPDTQSAGHTSFMTGNRTQAGKMRAVVWPRLANAFQIPHKARPSHSAQRCIQGRVASRATCRQMQFSQAACK